MTKPGWTLDFEALQKLIEMTTDLLGLTDHEGILKQINPAWQKTLGYAPEDLVGRSILTLLLPDDQKKLSALIGEFDRNEENRQGDFHALHKDGSLRYLSWHLMYLRERQAIFFKIRDITESKMLQESNEATNEILQRTINSLPILVAYLDTNFNYKFMNAAYEAWVGNLVANLKGGDLESAVGNESGRSLRQHRLEVLRTGLPARFEITFTNTGGEKRNLEVQYHPYRNPNGKVEGLMVLGFDLTEIKKANQAILSTENKLRRVLNDAKTGIWETDFSSGIFKISDNIRELMGIPGDLILTEDSFEKLVHPEDISVLREVQKKVHQTGKPFQTEFRVKWLDGDYHWLFSTGNPVLSEQGVATGVMGIFVDITARKQMEQTLQAQQIKMMNSSRLSAIGEMAGGVAHEINNPLAIILSHAESLKINSERGLLTPESIGKTTEKIKATVMRIAKIIRSMRTLSRDSEKDPFEFVPVKKIIEDTLEFCSQRFKDHEIVLTVDNQLEELSLFTRPTQVSQVLLNLLNNAHDAVENLDKRWVTLTTRDAGKFIEISVTDSGLGVPVDIRQKIFDPFFTTKGPSKGTGLGLSVSKSMISSLGGSLKLNEGSPQTQFVISIPKNLNNSASE